ncbi:isopenicillin N synthase family dioxygenase [Acidithiobacillus thiooxidans]|uniref:isopenicillin N synthase family dioxygenase n=1 Tax=Acidithiobacillus thiooxidans TaxID=930 RepID=UPI001C06EA2E
MSSLPIVRRVKDTTLPIINVKCLSSSRFEDRKMVGVAIRAACTENGFFYCSGHGIPLDLIDSVMTQTRALFDQPIEAKMKLEMSVDSNSNRGYERFGGQTLEAGTLPDSKEGYYIGRELPEDDKPVKAGRFYGPNVWPENLPLFKNIMCNYYQAMVELSELVLNGIALSLDLPEDYFDSYMREPLTTLRLLHYPPKPTDEASNQKGAGEHTDWGALTFLLQDAVAGLQVYDDRSGDWMLVEPLPGTLVVNIGDALAHWTNDLYKSTKHRVYNLSGRERYSVPFFYSGNPDYVVKCIPTCLATGETPRYAPITVEDHLVNMYKKTYG